MNNIDYSIYLVTDRDILNGTDLIIAVENAILGGATLVQLREKNASTREFYDLAIRLKEITDKYNIPLIINDRLDIAMAVEATGVHLGQSDMPLKVVRKILGNDKLIGISTSTLLEAEDAVKNGANYLGVGAIFPTNTKLDADKNSIDNLLMIKKSFSNIPIVGIGGINKNNLHLVKETGCDGVALVSAILGDNNIRYATSNLKKIWNN